MSSTSMPSYHVMKSGMLPFILAVLYWFWNMREETYSTLIWGLFSLRRSPTAWMRCVFPTPTSP